MLPDRARRAALRAFLAHEALPRGPWTAGILEEGAGVVWGGGVNGFDTSHVVCVPAAAVAAWKRGPRAGGEDGGAAAPEASAAMWAVQDSFGPSFSVQPVLSVSSAEPVVEATASHQQQQ